MHKHPLKVLFICTHNRCRSILCEAIANHYHPDVLLAKSAGSHPSGQVHPMTLKHLHQQGIDINGLSSQSWDEHRDFGADIVLTVCDSARGESCPIWLVDNDQPQEQADKASHCIQAHWGLNDPSKIKDSTQADNAFIEVITTIKQRMQALATLAKSHQQTPLKPQEMRLALQDIGVTISN